MYARDVGDRRLTFGVSGKLWRRSLVMYDPETDSLWSHILGLAMAGPLEGTRLEQIPGVMTDWASWQRDYPDSTVARMSRTSRNYRRQFYREQRDPDQFVLGIAEGGRAAAWGFDAMMKQPAINTKWGDIDVLVAFDVESMTPRLFDRALGDQTLTFRVVDGKFVDDQSGTTWSPTTGRAIAGEHADKHLRALPAIVSYRRTWIQFHPKSEITKWPHE